MLCDQSRGAIGWVADAGRNFATEDEDASARMDWIRRQLPELAAVPVPGGGETVSRWQALAEIAAIDGSLGRLAEGHLDALAIWRELTREPLPDPEHTWAVWAAHPALLRAAPTRGGWRLSGTKPWCSGAELVDQALLTAVDESGDPYLFRVDVESLTFADDWRPLGMRATASCTATVDLLVTAGRQVGQPGGYVGRPGFWHGGMGVAACWHGLASRIADDLAQAALDGHDPFLRAAAGRAVAELAESRTLLATAGRRIDADPASEVLGRRLAGIVRVAVEKSSRSILEESITAQGAAALCFDLEHARAIADLTVYLRQLHPGNDPASIDLDSANVDGLDWWRT